jgi:hypothetical protein
MCMNCGCGEPGKRHHPTDITEEDLQRSADGAGVSLKEAARNVQQSSEKLAGGQTGGQAAGAETWSSTKRA